MSREEKMNLIEPKNIDLSIRNQAFLLGLNRSGLYYHSIPPADEEIKIKHRIDEIYTELPFYGSRRITAQLRREGININRKAVQRHMTEMGIAGICPGPNLSKRNLAQYKYPYLLRNLDIFYPNQVWGIDITYIPLEKGWLYLVAILDWFSRYVISWELSQTLEAAFVLEAIRKGFQIGIPEIFNSDQGRQFTSPNYINLLKNAGVQISMDGKGRAIDNVFTERFWRTVKYEDVYLKQYQNLKETRWGITQFIDFYNKRRLHQALNYQTPSEIYWKGGEKRDKSEYPATLRLYPEPRKNI